MDEMYEIRQFDGRDYIWLKNDLGSWVGPSEDWKKEHKHKYFKHVKKFDTIITAGGNQGLYTYQYAKLFKNVYVFEPNILCFYALVRNNPFKNVFPFRAVLGETAKFVDFNDSDRVNTGGNYVIDRPGNIPCMTIDSFNFPDVDVIQLDVEGYEGNVLTGALATITQHSPVIILENDHHEPIPALMEKLGYKKVDQSVADSIFVKT